tara:strand:+ start:28030 stop:28338 length:309 start_codon:yes stop_codon:yes gene_type:complete
MIKEDIGTPTPAPKIHNQANGAIICKRLKKALYLPTILIITALSLVGCGGEDESALNETANEAMSDSSMKTTMESTKETVQTIKESAVDDGKKLSKMPKKSR